MKATLRSLPARSIQLVSRPLRPRLQVGQARAPAVARADVAAGVHVRARRCRCRSRCARRPESVAVADLGAELEERVGRRDPLQLQAVARVLAAEERLVRQRRVDEVPDVLMLLVQVADAGEEAAELRRESVRDRGERRRRPPRPRPFSGVSAKIRLPKNLSSTLADSASSDSPMENPRFGGAISPPVAKPWIG